MARIKKEKWEAYEGATDQIPLVNDPIGKPIFLREFRFVCSPGTTQWPDKEFIASQSQKAIEVFLWKDELKLIAPLRVIIDKDKGEYKIYAPCQPRSGSHLFEKPKTLQELFSKKLKGKRGGDEG